MTSSDLMIWVTLMRTYSMWIIWLESDDPIVDEEVELLRRRHLLAPAAIGHADAPPRRVMNSRRRMGPPR
jgi:hypothetical protein